MNRKKFITKSGRWLSVGLLVGLPSFIFLKRDVKAQKLCDKGQVCQQCLKFNSCSKDQAVQQRKDGK